jgi:Ca2+-binding EF-hand superfamily protein
MTLDDLRELLMENEVTNFDPVAEAFKAYDPEGTGYVDLEVLRSIFANLGFGDITNEDLGILVEAADVDGDGKVRALTLFSSVIITLHAHMSSKLTDQRVGCSSTAQPNCMLCEQLGKSL